MTAAVIDLSAARRVKAHAEASGLARLTQWRVEPNGRRERKEWAEMKAGAAKRFQFKGAM